MYFWLKFEICFISSVGNNCSYKIFMYYFLNFSELHTQIYPDYKYRPRKRCKASAFDQNGGTASEECHSTSSSPSIPVGLIDLSSKSKNIPVLNADSGSFISADGSLDLSVKGRSRISHESWDDFGGSTGVDFKSRRSSCVSSTTMLSEKDSHSTDSSFEVQFSPEPLNMSLKKSDISSGSGNFTSVRANRS